MSFNTIGKTVLKSLFSKPATAMYPVIKNEFYPNTRGRIENAIDDCIYCGICSKRCPAGAIEVSKPERKWEIDRGRCVICKFCVQVCPKKCLSTLSQYASPISDKNNRLYSLHSEKIDKETPQEDA